VTRWLVDGMNVIGSRPDGWWRDRRGAMRRLAEDLSEFARDTGDAVTVILDGAPFELTAEGVDVRFASRRGRNAADDDIAELAATAGDAAADLRVVTSDADLERRVRAHAIPVEGAGAFRRRLGHG